MSRLKHLWTLYKQLGIQSHLTYDEKRRILITNIMSLVLTTVVIIITLTLYNANL